MLGIVGFGAIGRRVAEIARALGMRVWAAGDGPPRRRSRSGSSASRSTSYFAASDVVTLHCPLSDATRGLVNAERLAQHAAERALDQRRPRARSSTKRIWPDALERGVIAGAALDVLSAEPPTPTIRCCARLDCVDHAAQRLAHAGGAPPCHADHGRKRARHPARARRRTSSTPQRLGPRVSGSSSGRRSRKDRRRAADAHRRHPPLGNEQPQSEVRVELARAHRRCKARRCT